MDGVGLGRGDRKGSYLCCAFDVLGVAADEGGLLLLVGHGWDVVEVFGGVGFGCELGRLAVGLT
jgi:hypothetical protein